jgi:hypothetical protein
MMDRPASGELPRGYLYLREKYAKHVRNAAARGMPCALTAVKSQGIKVSIFSTFKKIVRC